MDRSRRFRQPVAGILFCALALASAPVASADQDEFAVKRRALVAEIASERFGLPGRFDPRVLDAMRRVPRHLFVPPAMRPYAYLNRPLPIGHEQTISQPYIVALMTDLLRIGKEDRVLEVGTGSGYQAAVLSELAGAVFTIEIVEPLAREAAARLSRLGYRNVEVRAGDGYQGWKEAAPFDAIMVTAGATHVPAPLVEQLKPGGRLAIPVGPEGLSQVLKLVEKRADGTVHARDIAPVIFVPLTGGH